MTDDPRPEADRAGDAPHPRETQNLLGQSRAEQDFLNAFNSGRLHHGWMLTGPKGIGKATLAWRIARFLLAQPTGVGETDMFGQAVHPTTMDVPQDHPVTRRVLALAEPRLFLLRRVWNEKTKKLNQQITVDEARKLKSFFQLSAADGGRRVVIVDAADELNVSAANALLKVLEEPPRDTFLLLVTHQPSRLLPTIRSRCRELRCAPLAAEDLAQAVTQAGGDPQLATDNAALAGGSVGMALRLSENNGAALYLQMVDLLATAPRLDRPKAIALADGVAAKAGADRFDLVIELIDQLLARLARSGLTGPPTPAAAPNEAQVFARLCPDAKAARKWAVLHQEIGARARHGRAVNLDASSLILDMILKINDTASAMAA